ncbi:hypothetical protein D8B26_005417 [Coccidioides posadasii str. Silveira]|uniref:uncharacterized protein n=1 Tax=Coccidioides posadasii (strain RMSCC 757 / Silveira) TaxID=443226 RepID=UPI001BEEE49F|nr:hypothetical protein D8B26_005417 [Coccidioides posadasii str. Silveira]
MSSDDDKILRALNILLEASPDSLTRLRSRITETFRQINNKLTSRPPQAVALLDALSKKLGKVKEFLQRSEHEAVGFPFWTEIDPRLSDIRRLSNSSSDQEKFRAFLAVRSLALDQEAWQREKYGSSRVDDLAHNLSSSNDHCGYVREFCIVMKLGGVTASNGIKLGQKILVNERMFPRNSGSTALYAFFQDKFRRIPYERLTDLNEMLSAPDYDSIGCVAAEKTSYIKNAQHIYCGKKDKISSWRRKLTTYR